MDKQTAQIINDPAFQKLLAKRSRLRWGLTAMLVLAYVAYGFAGVWYPDELSQSFLGTRLSWVMAIAYFIMLLSVLTSLLYVRIVGKMYRRPGSAT